MKKAGGSIYQVLNNSRRVRPMAKDQDQVVMGGAEI